MPEVLSQQEIDSLLSGIASKETGVEDILKDQGDYDRELVSYDFRRPNRFSKNQLRTMQSVHEVFAEAFSYFLVSKLQTIVSVRVTSVDQLFYSEFILSLSNPSCLYVFQIGASEGFGILELSSQLAFTFVERLLGGNGEATKKSRVITQIEQSVIRGIVERALTDLQTAWRAISALAFKFNRFESEPDFVQLAPASEIVLVVTFEITIGNHTFLMNLCFPTFALEDVISRLNIQHFAITSTKSQDTHRSEVIGKQLNLTRVPVVARLGETEITIRELLVLEAGDVIRLDTRIDSEIEVDICGKRKCYGRPGVFDNKKAIKITRFPKPEDTLGE
jgi:flagellar motor switch protein FliM